MKDFKVIKDFVEGLKDEAVRIEKLLTLMEMEKKKKLLPLKNILSRWAFLKLNIFMHLMTEFLQKEDQICFLLFKESKKHHFGL